MTTISRYNGARLQHAWEGLIIAIVGQFVGGFFIGMYLNRVQPDFTYMDVTIEGSNPYWILWLGVTIAGFSSALFFVALVTLAIVWALDISRGR